MRAFTLFCLVPLLLLTSLPAKACITPMLKSPPDVEVALQSGKEANPEQLKRAEDFKRDKEYYEALAIDFCTKTMMQSSEKERNINQDIRNLLIEKWKFEEGK